ncbi:MAG: hypothetical protein M1831_000170 [Alyxoria varia]|nr:MAG: hypothetical protein M1831_000170 [Alyxoria varia]
MAERRPTVSAPVTANFPAATVVTGCGVAIFHVATNRVVLCSHPDYPGMFFLPKGRKDVGETTENAAQREGFEESGYRNRVLPLPFAQRQPNPAADASTGTDWLFSEPIYTQLMPLRSDVQYILHWYIAETLSPDDEAALSSGTTATYKAPPPYPAHLSLPARVERDPQGYEPAHHQNTGVDDEERKYNSSLVDVDEAIRRLSEGTVMGRNVIGLPQADVVRRGKAAIGYRFNREKIA